MVSFSDKRSVDQRTRLRIIQAALLLATPFVLLASPFSERNATMHEFLEIAGTACIFVCIVGRLWSILYSGGAKSARLVTSGPYSISRNPLYLFSTIGAFGAGLVMGSVVLATLFGATCYVVLKMTSRTEETFLRMRFGAEYDAYLRRVPPFRPNFSLYREADRPEFSPSALRRTLGDAMYFLLAIPLAEGLDYLHAAEVIPAVLSLY